jgi:hypothetical protein
MTWAKCLWVELPAGNPFSSAFPPDYSIGCHPDLKTAGMINGYPFSYCPYCGKEIESTDNTGGVG